jgi:hypothetical protein
MTNSFVYGVDVASSDQQLLLKEAGSCVVWLMENAIYFLSIEDGSVSETWVKPTNQNCWFFRLWGYYEFCNNLWFGRRSGFSW